MADPLDTIAILTAINSDPLKAQRLTELGEVLEKIRTERQAMEDRGREIEAAAETSRRTLAEAKAAQEDVAQREKALAEERTALTGVIKSHTEEKQRFEANRQVIEADHAAREDKNAADESRLADMDETLAKRARDLTVREANAGQIEAAVKRRMIAMKAALETP